MLRYFAVPRSADGLCGLAYSLQSGDHPVLLRLPALTAQVQVTLAGAVYHDCVSGARPDPALALLGPTHMAADVILGAQSRVIGLGLLPAGWARTVRASAAELAGVVVAGDAVWGVINCLALLEEMHSAPDDGAAAGALFRFIVARQVARNGDRDRRIAVTTEWLSRAGSVEVTCLSNALDLSLRQTERFTSQMFGGGPKLLELKYRVLRLAAVSAISQTRVYDLERYDLLDSFYDQSHLIRNFNRFVGFAPKAFDDRADFARSMLRGRWEGGARTPLTLWS